MATLIFENYEDFLLRENKADNGVSKKFAENNEEWAEMNETNIGCWNCKDCEECIECEDCEECKYCKKSKMLKKCSSLKRCENCEQCKRCELCFNCKKCFAIHNRSNLFHKTDSDGYVFQGKAFLVNK